MDPQFWQTVFAAVNTVVVLGGVPIAIWTLRRAVSQRMGESLSKVLEEYRDEEFEAARRLVIASFPISNESPVDRVAEFLKNLRRYTPPQLAAARLVVRKLNDLAALVDRGAVREIDLFGQTHPILIQLSARLDPLILVVSSLRGYRWGLRMRRLGLGAQAYYAESPLHRMRSLAFQGVVVVPASSDLTVFRRALVRLRRVLAKRGRYMPSPAASRRAIEEDLRRVGEIVSGFDPQLLKRLERRV